MPTLLLEDLTERISQQEAQLQTLRRELETRQRQLADLSEQKQGLLTKLQQIDAQIAGIAGGSQSVKTSQPKTAPAKPVRVPVIGEHVGNGVTAMRSEGKALSKGASPKAKTKQTAKARQPSLPGLILTMLREAGRPLMVKELAEGALRRGFWSSSVNYLHMVTVRAREMQRNGILKEAIGQPGFVLAKGHAAPTAAPGKKQNGGLVERAATPAAGTTSSKAIPAQPGSLRGVLTQILRKSPKPLTASELTAQALEAGYRSTSKNFVDVVRVSMGKMADAEHLPNQGYRLKKAKA